MKAGIAESLCGGPDSVPSTHPTPPPRLPNPWWQQTEEQHLAHRCTSSELLDLGHMEIGGLI